MFAFTGSRRLSSTSRQLVESMVASLNHANHPISVGCASGLDSFVRTAPGFNGQVFRAESKHASSLVQRSALMVQSVAASPGSVHAILAFPDCACPAGLRPSPSVGRCFCGKGSGSWATMALAAGLGIPVFVFNAIPSDLPTGWGDWEESYQFGALAFRCPPAPTQLSLF